MTCISKSLLVMIDSNCIAQTFKINPLTRSDFNYGSGNRYKDLATCLELPIMVATDKKLNKIMKMGFLVLKATCSSKGPLRNKDWLFKPRSGKEKVVLTFKSINGSTN